MTFNDIPIGHMFHYYDLNGFIGIAVKIDEGRYNLIEVYNKRYDDDECCWSEFSYPKSRYYWKTDSRSVEIIDDGKYMGN